MRMKKRYQKPEIKALSGSEAARGQTQACVSGYDPTEQCNNGFSHVGLCNKGNSHAGTLPSCDTGPGATQCTYGSYASVAHG